MANYTAYGISDQESGDNYAFGDQNVRGQLEDGFKRTAGIGGLRVDIEDLVLQVDTNYGVAGQDPDWQDVSGGGGGGSSTTVQIPSVTVGTYTYNGNTQGPTITGLDTVHTTVTGATATAVGSYTLTIALKNPQRYTWSDSTTADKTYSWSIGIASLAVPSVTGAFTYDGSQKTATVGSYDSNLISQTGDTTGTNAGTYTVTFSLQDTTNCKWNDDSITDKPVAWSIAKADQTLSITKNAVTLNTNTTSDTVTASGYVGTLSATSDTPSVASASVNGSVVTIATVNNTNGSATVTITAGATTNYNAASKTVTVTASFAGNYGIRLNLSDTNPTTWATYLGDAVGMTAGSSDWDDFFGVSEVLLNNGVEGATLNPDNLAQTKAGGTADITSGSAGDVMTKFGKVLGWKVTKSGTTVDIYLTDEQNKSGYCYKAFYYKGQLCSAIYRGCFKGYEDNSKLWSLSGKTITANKTISAFRTLAQAKGTGYEQSTYYALQLLQIMYLLKYKGANAQDKTNGGIGRGFVDGNSAAPTTGGTVSKGRDYGETTGKEQMCFLSQEDFYGGIREWIDGLVTDSGRNYLVCDPTTSTAFSDTGTSYVNVGGGWSSNQSGYVSDIIGSNDAPLTASGFSGSETTLFCDYAFANVSRVAYAGGSWDDASYAGVFYVYVTYAPSAASAGVGSRLMYYKVAS